MKINNISIFCEDYNENKYPKVEIIDNNTYVSMYLYTEENSFNKIVFYMKEQDLINFKNSVVSAVDNYKRGK